MESLKALNAARLSETRPLTRHHLAEAEDVLRDAIKLFCADHTADNMIVLNGAWALAYMAYKSRTPSGPDSPVGGSVDWRERKAA